MPNFPICPPSSKKQKNISSFWCFSIFATFRIRRSEERVLIKRLSVERTSDGACAIPRVTEEINWESTEAAKLSIVERLDDFIAEPVDKVLRQLREESDIERASYHASTPDLRDKRRPLTNWDADVHLSTDEPSISETVTNWISSISSSNSPDSDDRFFFG